jgi:polyhydroxyalkanoate synthesis regulator phasin
MNREDRKEQFRTWLHRAWNAAVRTAEAMEQTPVNQLFDRVDQLEREVAALKKEGAARVGGP